MWDFRCIGPSSFDCVYNFSQASSQHKYTVTSHQAYDNILYTRSCAALRGWDPPPYDRSNICSLIRVANILEQHAFLMCVDIVNTVHIIQCTICRVEILFPCLCHKGHLHEITNQQNGNSPRNLLKCLNSIFSRIWPMLSIVLTITHQSLI